MSAYSHTTKPLSLKLGCTHHDDITRNTIHPLINFSICLWIPLEIMEGSLQNTLSIVDTIKKKKQPNSS